MNQMQKEIVTYIRQNRVSTTEVADCLGKTGVIPGVHSINRGNFCVGPVCYVYGHSQSNWPIHDQARRAKAGEVVIMDGIEVEERALVGYLVTKFLLLYKEAAGIVMLGNARDANDLIKQRSAVWCKGFNPVGCFNKDVSETPEITAYAQKQQAYYDGAVAVCDDTGVVIIPKEQMTEEFLQKLKDMEAQEDMWFNCIDHNKWDTYDTVCLKKYLQ